MTDLTTAVCAIEIAGVANLAPILLHRDGTYTLTAGLTRADENRCREWISRAGDRFRVQNADLLDEVPR